MRVCLQPMDFMQISTIASLHSIGLLCPTKPSKRAVHGAVSPCPGVHAGAFLRFMGIILQYLSRCASRSFGSTSAEGKFPVRRSPSLKILSILQINFQLYFPLYCIFPQHTRHQPHIPRERIHPPHFSHSVRGVSRRSDCHTA